MNELHLTEANKADIRALVRLMSPDFEAGMFERINLLRAQREAKEKSERDAMEQQMRHYQAQAQSAQAPVVIPYIGTAAVTSNPTLTNPFTHTVPTLTAASTYAPMGTGFTSYGPLDPIQGLNLKK